VLKASWTKGGKTREVPLETDAQREALALAHRIAGRGSLIPPEHTYVEQLRIYERQSANAGLSKLHGLRHQYAQARYRTLTELFAETHHIEGGGWSAPADGGPSRSELSRAQLEIDQSVRMQISRELGHEREQISTIYLGR